MASTGVCKTGDEHLASLRDGRAVYIFIFG
jgi:hypothetical protein